MSYHYKDELFHMARPLMADNRSIELVAFCLQSIQNADKKIVF